MGFYVYVFKKKNKYCCLMVDVDFLSVLVRLKVGASYDYEHNVTWQIPDKR